MHDLEQLLFTIEQLDNGSGFTDKVRKAEKIAKKLNSPWLDHSERPSLIRFLFNLATEGFEPSEKKGRSDE